MDGREPQAVEDFTGTCLLLGLINLTWIFFAVWAWQGFWAVLALAVLLNFAITQLDGWLNAQRQRYAPGQSQRQ